MILTSLTKPNLVLLAEELGIPVQKSMRKPAIIEAISKCGANDDEVEECWRAVSEKLKEREVELKTNEPSCAMRINGGCSVAAWGLSSSTGNSFIFRRKGNPRLIELLRGDDRFGELASKQSHPDDRMDQRVERSTGRFLKIVQQRPPSVSRYAVSVFVCHSRSWNMLPITEPQ
ncbi:hypothetical protein MRX96_054686 [Rhipicephalus microplus]